MKVPLLLLLSHLLVVYPRDAARGHSGEDESQLKHLVGGNLFESKDSVSESNGLHLLLDLGLCKNHHCRL